MLGDELFGGQEERGLRTDWVFSPLEVVDEQPHRFLFLRGQRSNGFSKAFGCHSDLPPHYTAQALVSGVGFEQTEGQVARNQEYGGTLSTAIWLMLPGT